MIGERYWWMLANALAQWCSQTWETRTSALVMVKEKDSCQRRSTLAARARCARGSRLHSAINTHFSNFSGFMLYIFFSTHQTCEGEYTIKEEKRPTMIKVCLCAELLWSWSPWKGFLTCHPPAARRKIKVHPDGMPYVRP